MKNHLLVMLVMAASGSGSLANYLRVIGPAPLRFQDVPVRQTAAISKAREEVQIPSEASTNAAVKANETTGALPELPPVVFTAKSPSNTETNESPDILPPWAMPPEGPFVSADMALPYFRGTFSGTNTVGATITPVIFVPPTRVQRAAPSKATYTTP